MPPPFPAGQYGVIYCDPPWSYEMYSEKGYEKSPQAHYDCMPLAQLKALRDQILFAAAPDCVLWMWGLWSMLPQLTDLMREWGFQHKSGGNWDKVTRHGKQAFGSGYIFRASSEPFALGTIGNPRIKNRRTRNSLFTGDVPENLNDLGICITSLRREHSRKPDEIPALIEDLFDGPYLELFGRTQRPGWAVWGNETDKFKKTAA
jgi:N6-adenosine-specific RNA methylase IME4